MKKCIALIFLFFLILTGCTSSLVKGLPKDVREWYDFHKIILDMPMPWWTNQGCSEAQYFLRLPLDLQRMYIDLFWSMRVDGAQERFNARYQFAVKFYSDAGQRKRLSDRGRWIVMCGLPDDIRDITEHDLYSNMSMEQRLNYPNGNLEGVVYQVWTYYFDARIYTVTFEWNHDRFRFYGQSVDEGGDLSRLYEEGMKDYAQSPEAWEVWLEKSGLGGFRQ